MATGDRVRTIWQYQHEVIEAAQERGWAVIRIDARQGVTVEEPVSGGVLLNIAGGHLLDLPAFIRSLPEARQIEGHTITVNETGPVAPR